jgi:putative serine protease PepD
VSPPGASAWWSDAFNDPWRDPTAQTEIVVTAPPPGTPAAVEPVVDPEAPRPVRLLPVVLATALVAGLLAGALGGAFGYLLATRDQSGTVLGADPGTEPAALAQRPPDSVAGVVEQVMPSVVTIRSGVRGATNLGSGFVVSSDGHLITNDHVLEGASAPPEVTFHDGTTAPATLVGRDPESDIAILQVDRGGLEPVRLGESAAVAVGDPVFAFGSPLALTNTVTSGIVSAVDRAIRAGDPGEQVRYYAAIQTDAAVNQGNSGGPLVDAAGRVIGVNSVIKSVAATPDQAASIGLAFAIPISQARRVAQDIIDTGEARRTVIGAEVDERRRIAGGGARLASVVAGGPAEEAGLRAGDVVVRFNGLRLVEPAELIALVRKHDPGTVVTVEYRRGSTHRHASVGLVADGG